MYGTIVVGIAMTERLRVLMAVTNWTGTFTVFDIAERAGVNVATVRTVVSRERRYIEEVGRLETSARGGRAIRYIVKESQLAELRQELSRVQMDLPRIAIEPPVALVMAADVLRRQFEDAENDRERSLLIESGLRHLEDAAESLRAMEDGSDDLSQLKSEFFDLQQLAGGHKSTFKLPPFFISAEPTAEELKQKLTQIFEECRQSVCATPAQALGQGAVSGRHLVAAASQFSQRAGEVRPHSVSVEDIATKISRSINPKFPMDALLLLGRDPAAYQPGALRLSGALDETVSINTRVFNAARDFLDRLGLRGNSDIPALLGI